MSGQPDRDRAERRAAARAFVEREGRLLERRLAEVCFDGASPDGVVDALCGYRNGDGGFGHGLEPDKRCPASLPIDVEFALQTLVAAGGDDDALVSRACAYLHGTAATVGAGGALPLAFPVIEAYPRASHWTDWTYQPGLNPTAGLVGLLLALGAQHPWMGEAAGWCWRALEAEELPEDAHALSEAMVFLAWEPDRERARRAALRVRESLRDSELFHADPDAEGYGLSPLAFAPTAESPWRTLFEEETIQAHLDRLERDQQADGGWPVTWEPPSQASLLDWRGIVTVGALRTLTSYGRLD